MSAYVGGRGRWRQGQARGHGAEYWSFDDAVLFGALLALPVGFLGYHALLGRASSAAALLESDVVSPQGPASLASERAAEAISHAAEGTARHAGAAVGQFIGWLLRRPRRAVD